MLGRLERSKRAKGAQRSTALSQNGYGERLKAYISAYLTTNCKAREKRDKEERRRTAEKENNAFTANRNYPVRQKGCAERIAPIGTLSQNGYGESLVAYINAYLTTNCKAPLQRKETNFVDGGYVLTAVTF